MSSTAHVPVAVGPRVPAPGTQQSIPGSDGEQRAQQIHAIAAAAAAAISAGNQGGIPQSFSPLQGTSGARPPSPPAPFGSALAPQQPAQPAGIPSAPFHPIMATTSADVDADATSSLDRAGSHLSPSHARSTGSGTHAIVSVHASNVGGSTHGPFAAPQSPHALSGTATRSAGVGVGMDASPDRVTVGATSSDTADGYSRTETAGNLDLPKGLSPVAGDRPRTNYPLRADDVDTLDGQAVEGGHMVPPPPRVVTKPSDFKTTLINVVVRVIFVASIIILIFSILMITTKDGLPVLPPPSGLPPIAAPLAVPLSAVATIYTFAFLCRKQGDDEIKTPTPTSKSGLAPLSKRPDHGGMTDVETNRGDNDDWKQPAPTPQANRHRE